VCARDGMVFIPWAPIARGSSDRLEREASGQRLEALAKTRGVSALQLALAWLLAKSPAMLPIPGTSSVEHLNENVAAAQLKLTAEEMTLIG
jgi:pyridoxine 4-dehydrogenase